MFESFVTEYAEAEDRIRATWCELLAALEEHLVCCTLIPRFMYITWKPRTRRFATITHTTIPVPLTRRRE